MAKEIEGLLRRLKDEIQGGGLTYGLCYTIITADGFTSNERDLLREYLYKNQAFTIRRLLGNEFWWKPGEVAPRIKWLDKQIKKCQT